jgi:hypothetical protein
MLPLLSTVSSELTERSKSLHTYFKEKLFEALTALVVDGDIDQRLTFAASYLVTLQDRDVPERLREDFRQLKDALTRTPLSTDRDCENRQISTENARDHALKILSLFTEVMGGL